MVVSEVDGAASIETYDGSPFPIRHLTDFYAVGTGGQFAVAAMYLGLAAEAAVIVASKFDHNTGFEVDTLTIEGIDL